MIYHQIFSKGNITVFISVAGIVYPSVAPQILYCCSVCSIFMFLSSFIDHCLSCCLFPLAIVLSVLQFTVSDYTFLRRVWRYQRGNQNPYIEEEQTKKWLKEKVQEDKQRSTKHTYKTKDRVSRTPLKNRAWTQVLRKGSSSCSTSDTRRVNLVTNPVIRHEWGKNREHFFSIDNNLIWNLTLIHSYHNTLGCWLPFILNLAHKLLFCF
jgi:hypothetical protein